MLLRSFFRLIISYRLSSCLSFFRRRTRKTVIAPCLWNEEETKRGTRHLFLLPACLRRRWRSRSLRSKRDFTAFSSYVFWYYAPMFHFPISSSILMRSKTFARGADARYSSSPSFCDAPRENAFIKRRFRFLQDIVIVISALQPLRSLFLLKALFFTTEHSLSLCFYTCHRQIHIEYRRHVHRAYRAGREYRIVFSVISFLIIHKYITDT